MESLVYCPPTYPPIVALTWKKLVLLGTKLARTFTDLYALTPARADLLYELRGGPVAQRDLVLNIGVSPPVVSRMLGALEALGYVFRTRDPDLPRCKIVHLTKEGATLIALLMNALYERGREYPLQWLGEDILLRRYAHQFWKERVKAPPPNRRDRTSLVRSLQLAVRRHARLPDFPWS